MGTLRTASNIVIYGTLTLGLICSPILAGELHFHSERIQISVAEHKCEVVGEYVFQNTSSNPAARFPLYYPFPAAPDLPFPNSIHVVNAQTGAAVPFTEQKSGIVFQIDVPPAARGVYTVHYQQPTPVRHFEYILETTARWRRALAAAEFSITIPKDWMVTYLSMDHDHIQVDDSVKTYHITRQDFMPDGNLIIRWERNNHGL